jgi:methylamine--corrinoid protein Co-methyltransferase
MYSYAKEPLVDVLYVGLLNSINGMTIKPRTPLEMAAARREALLAREALKMAGRPGLCITGLVHITAEATAFADHPEGLRPTDIHEIDPLNELKIDIETLKRIYYCRENNYITSSAMCPLIGGFAGGPEGVAIVGVAEALQAYTIIGAHIFLIGTTNIRTGSGTDKAALWAGAVALSALKSTQNVIVGDLIWTAAGPCTDVVCYEIAAKTITDVACGADIISSAGCTRGKMIDHYTGMEARIAGLVAKASNINLKQASDIVKELVNLYNNRVIRGELPTPKSFAECYDLESMTPKAEYLSIWENCKNKLEELGLAIRD